MPGSDHSAAWVGLWKRAVASNTARPAAAGSAAANSPRATPSAMIRASWPTRCVDVGRDHLPRLGGELDVGREQLRVVARPAALGGDQQVEPAPQPLRRGPSSAADRGQRLGDAGQPALGDRVAQRRLAREVPVDAAVADAERAGDVDHGRLGGPVAAQDVLGRLQDPLGGERRSSASGRAQPRSLSRIAICWAS